MSNTPNIIDGVLFREGFNAPTIFDLKLRRDKPCGILINSEPALQAYYGSKDLGEASRSSKFYFNSLDGFEAVLIKAVDQAKAEYEAKLESE